MKNENKIDDKVKDVIDIIKNMDLKNKLRLGVCISSSAYTNLKYNKSHIHSIFDKRLKEIDNEYLTSYINMRKYSTILFVMAKIMEMNNTEQSQVAMYLFNTVNETSVWIKLDISWKKWYNDYTMSVLLLLQTSCLRSCREDSES